MTTILIVDDQPDNLYVLRRLLTGQGYTVTEAQSGEQALGLVPQAPPDLILLDVMMPGIDGFEVVKRLRSNPATTRLPVILLTANAPDQRLKIQGLNLGADEYLTQPINNNELLARVRGLLRTKESQDALEAVNRRLQALLDVVQASTSTLELAEVGQRVVDGTLQATGMDRAGIWLCEGSDLVLLAQIGYRPEFVASHQRITPARREYALEVVATRKPIYGTTATLFQAADRHDQPDGSVIMLPLLQGDQALGVVQLGVSASRTFTQAEIEFLQAIANAAATPIQNARLFAASVQSRRELEAVNQEKDEFISIVSHELKNPLASIKGYASLLQRRTRKDPALANAFKGLDVIEQQVGRMNLLLDQLRDATNIGINRFAIEGRVLDVTALVERVASELQATAPTHEVLLTINDAPLFATVDEFRISQVLSNLIGNAIKYSPNGTPVHVAVAHITADQAPVKLEAGEWICIDVTDEGIGIAPDEQERLFERFFRAENAKREASGMGLGLFIAREIVILHGGTMWVRSEVGVGSTFSFALPLEKE